MSNYFRMDTTFVKSTKERLFSTKPTVATELSNGVIGYLGSYISEEIRTLLVPTSDLILKQMPVIVGNPEINYKEDSRTDSALGAYRNASGKALRTFPLEQYDVITLSQDFFDLTGKATGVTTSVEVGDMFAIQANLVAGTQLKYSATAPLATANKVYFKVTKVANAYTPTFVNGAGALYPATYKLVDVELIIA